MISWKEECSPYPRWFGIGTAGPNGKQALLISFSLCGLFIAVRFRSFAPTVYRYGRTTTLDQAFDLGVEDG